MKAWKFHYVVQSVRMIRSEEKRIEKQLSALLAELVAVDLTLHLQKYITLISSCNALRKNDVTFKDCDYHK